MEFDWGDVPLIARLLLLLLWILVNLVIDWSWPVHPHLPTSKIKSRTLRFPIPLSSWLVFEAFDTIHLLLGDWQHSLTFNECRGVQANPPCRPIVTPGVHRSLIMFTCIADKTPSSTSQIVTPSWLWILSPFYHHSDPRAWDLHVILVLCSSLADPGTSGLSRYP